MPDRDAARSIALRCTASIRGQHDWGRRFEPEPEDVLERCPQLAPREMRRAWMTAFGNAQIETGDLPDAGGGKRTPMGFVH
jgi:ATP-dependent Lon protease